MRTVLVLAAVLLAAAVLTPTKLPGLHPKTCPRASVVDIPPDVPVDQSVRDIFGIERFISKREWDAVKDKVVSGGVGIVRGDAGRPDSAIFLEKGRTAAHSPMLVKVIGTRLDAGVTDHPRQGIWLVDYCADGTIDRIVDYGERRGAGEPRPMVIYYSTFAYAQPGVIVTTAPMATSDYEYVQDLDQWRSGLRGDSYIAMFSYSYARRALVPLNEAPFCFYDFDGDGMSEIALRLEIPLQASWIRSRLRAARYLFDRFAVYGSIATVRYSLNLNDNPSWDAPYHYDFSVTGIGKLIPPATTTTRLQLWNTVTEPIVACGRARETVEGAEWTSLSLTWNEDDLNYAEGDEQKRDRWEGVINRGSESFPQVGGPPSRPFNTRTEIASGSLRRMRLYYSEIDRRIHLYGAKRGRLQIDYNQDGKIDMEIRYEDTTGAGVFDKWEVVIDGVYDRTYVASDPRATPLEWAHDRLTAFYRARRRATISEYEETIARMKAAMNSRDALPIERYYFDALRQENHVGRRLRVSAEAKRFYLSVMLELHFRELRKWLGDQKVPRADIAAIEQLFGAGRHREMLEVLDGAIRRNLMAGRVHR